jgi:hypothetical protein
MAALIYSTRREKSACSRVSLRWSWLLISSECEKIASLASPKKRVVEQGFLEFFQDGGQERSRYSELSVFLGSGFVLADNFEVMALVESKYRRRLFL